MPVRGLAPVCSPGELIVIAEMAALTDDQAGFGESRRIRVVIVGAHPLLCWALRRIAEDAPDLQPVAEAGTADAAINQVFSLKPHVVVIDCSMDDGAGWRLARDLRDRNENLGIVLLTPDASDDLLFRALDTGASAYLSKSASVAEVAGAIRHAAVAASSFTAAGLAQALRRRRDVNERLALSPRERQVLVLLRDGCSVPEVAATIYVSLSTAKTYVARLYEKLGANNRAQALMTAVELGLFDDQRTEPRRAGIRVAG
jgi:DNA-binding NarL/FixJ family response regulator